MLEKNKIKSYVTWLKNRSKEEIKLIENIIKNFNKQNDKN